MVIKCSNSSETLQTAFALRIHNPCIDPTKVEFPMEVEMPESVEYTLEDSELLIAS